MVLVVVVFLVGPDYDHFFQSLVGPSCGHILLVLLSLSLVGPGCGHIWLVLLSLSLVGPACTLFLDLTAPA